MARTHSFLLRSSEFPSLFCLTRGRSDGIDLPRCELVSLDRETLTISVPGHRERSGYDRLGVGRNQQYEYVRKAEHELRVVSVTEDRYPGYFIIVAERTDVPAPSRVW